MSQTDLVPDCYGYSINFITPATPSPLHFNINTTNLTISLTPLFEGDLNCYSYQRNYTFIKVLGAALDLLPSTIINDVLHIPP